MKEQEQFLGKKVLFGGQVLLKIDKTHLDLVVVE